jgi:uncharacterized damage-inducible protein DinB
VISDIKGSGLLPVRTSVTHAGAKKGNVMFTDHFSMMAAYNGWANHHLYAAAARLPAETLDRPTGAFFGSLLSTLNHILVADRIWMSRFTGAGPVPRALNEVLFSDFAALQEARMIEDARIIDWVETLTEADLASEFTYSPVSSTEQVNQRLFPALAHMFNHQTHHRGQCHMILTSLGEPSLALDLIYFQRSEGRWK